MKKFAHGALWAAFQAALIATLVLGAVATAPHFALWWAKWDLIEPLLGLVGVAAGAPAAWFFLLPRRSAWVMWTHADQGASWLQTQPVWSPRAADEMAAKAAYSSAFGKFAGAADAQFPAEPKALHTHVVWVGRRRGVYRVYGFQVGDHVPGQFGVEVGATAPMPVHEKAPKAPPLGW